jgi:hypothetical protein
MEHALVRDGEVIRLEDFDTTPTLAPNKGAWVPVVDGVEPAPEGEVQIGTSVELQDGVPVRVGVYAAPPRREIEKLVVQERLKAIDKLDAAWTILQSDPDTFGKWIMDGKNVFADEPLLLGLLTAIGCTEEEIAAVTA